VLVLSRKVGESIRIGDDIVVMVTSIEGDKVRIGIEGPREVPIHREELYQKIKRENLQAASIGLDDAELVLKKLK